MKRQRDYHHPNERMGHGFADRYDANVVRGTRFLRSDVSKGASGRFSEAGTGRSKNVLRKFPGGFLDPLWPGDPAQSPDLFCQLEARLADGHRNAEQTKTIQQCLTSLPRFYL